jgi:hypothetical protein
MRDIAERLQIDTQDTGNRPLRALIRAGVVEVIPRDDADAFAPTTYVLHLDASGITLLDLPA